TTPSRASGGPTATPAPWTPPPSRSSRGGCRPGPRSGVSTSAGPAPPRAASSPARPATTAPGPSWPTWTPPPRTESIGGVSEHPPDAPPCAGRASAAGFLDACRSGYALPVALPPTACVPLLAAAQPPPPGGGLGGGLPRPPPKDQKLHPAPTRTAWSSPHPV